MEENKNIEETVEVKDRESQQAGSAEGKAGAEAKDGQENRKRKSRKEEKKEDEALRKQIEELSDKVDYIVDGGECEVGLESTVVRVVDGVPTILRPGKISPEDIQKVVGAVKIDEHILKNI